MDMQTDTNRYIYLYRWTQIEWSIQLKFDHLGSPPYTYIYLYHTWKKFQKRTTATKKIHLPFRRIFSLILGWFLAILCRFWMFSDVFGQLTTATNCQDADFFPAMIYIHTYKHTNTYLGIYVQIYIHRKLLLPGQ